MGRREQEKSTLAYYNQHASEFNAHRGEGVSRYWSEELAHFQKLLPRGTVLEVGCGVGNEAIILKEMGYEYVGVDISMGMLSIAKLRCPDANFICQDLRSPSTSFFFDGFVAIASLLHLEKSELTSTLSTLRKQLRSGGIGLLTLKEGVGTKINSKGRFYSYYSPEELARHVTDSGFNLIDISLHEEKDQKDQSSFICCFVENP